MNPMNQMENPFFGALNESIKSVVPLAMRKWELDQHAEQWKQQMEETKRAHEVSIGTALLNSGNVEAAEPILRRALNIPDMNLVASPANQLKTAQGMEALRAIEARKNISARLKALVKGGVEEQPTYRDSWMPEGVATPTEKVTAPGKTLTLEDIAQIYLQEGEDTIGLKALIQESNLGTKEKELGLKEKLADINTKSREAIADMRMKVAEHLANLRYNEKAKPEFSKADLLKYKNDLRQTYKTELQLLIDPNLGGIKRGKEQEAAELKAQFDAAMQEADDAFRGTNTLKKAAKSSDMPDPAKYKGRTGTDTATGKRYKSNGTKWVEIK